MQCREESCLRFDPATVTKPSGAKVIQGTDRGTAMEGEAIMTRCRLYWLAYAACVGLAVFWGVRLLTPRHCINRENFEKIQIGMSQEEVESLLGAPPGDYTRGSLLVLAQEPSKNINWVVPPWDLTWGDARWIGKDAAVAVWLDPQKCVTKTEFAVVICFNAETTFLDKFRGWLGLENKVNHQVCFSSILFI